MDGPFCRYQNTDIGLAPTSVTDCTDGTEPVMWSGPTDPVEPGRAGQHFRLDRF